MALKSGGEDESTMLVGPDVPPHSPKISSMAAIRAPGPAARGEVTEVGVPIPSHHRLAGNRRTIFQQGGQRGTFWRTPRSKHMKVRG